MLQWKGGNACSLARDLLLGQCYIVTGYDIYRDMPVLMGFRGSRQRHDK